MEVRLEQVSRHFYYRWVFKNLSYTFQRPVWYSIIGHNGSGKSTLLQVISGFLSPSKGRVTYHRNGQDLPLESGYQYLSIATPYLDLVEEFSPEEHLSFHCTFKALKPSITIDHILRATGLQAHRKKAIKFFSSGMIQRLRLAQALYFDTPLVLLDEPTSHLDQQGVAWYQELLRTLCQDQCVIIASNNPADYQQCSFGVSIETYKPATNSG